MFSNNPLKSIIQMSIGTSLVGIGCILSTSEIAKANCLDEFGTNPSSVTSSCEITPDRYLIKVYEMGFCTSDPLSASDFSDATCTSTFKSTGGAEVNVVGNVVDLIGSNSRPPANDYGFAYIKMSNTFGLRGTYEMNSTTYCSSADGTAETTAGCTGTDYNETLVDFNQGGTCSGDPSYAADATFTTGIAGTMKAKLTNDSYITSTSCGNSTRLVGMFAPTEPISIKETTQGLEVDFTVTNTGMTVVPNRAGNAVSSFSSGPFRPRFRSY